MKLWNIISVLLALTSFGNAQSSASKIIYVLDDNPLNLSTVIHHMDVDRYLYNFQILISTDTGLITTNGNNIWALTPSMDIHGFTQINATHVVLIDRIHHCLRMLDRVTSHIVVLAGTCGTTGYSDGLIGTGKFYNPDSVVVDTRNAGQVLVTDTANNALRSVSISTGEVRTVIDSGFELPQGLLWASDHLLVTNYVYISSVRWLDNGTIVNYKVAFSRLGDVYGTMDESKVRRSSNLVRLREKMFLIDDTGSRKLKLVDFNEGLVKPFCIYQEDICTTNSSALPRPAIKAPMLKVGDDTIYVALATSVYKLKGVSSESGFPVECPDSGNATIYIIPGRRKLTFSLDNGLTIDLSEGHYTLPKDDGPLLCKEHFNVMKSPIVRRLSFKSVYEVRCNLLEYDSDTRIVLRNTLLHRRSQLLTVCREDCTMSDNMMPFSECTDGQLTVYWPTDVMFPIDVHQPPTELVNRLEQRIEAIDSMINMEIFILYHSPPVIAAAKGPNNKAVQITLYSACANNRKSYDVERDVCV